MSLLKELKRRNVFRVGIAYVIVAWLIAQVTELALNNFGAPDWVIKTVLYLLVIGFPLAMLFAWAFELTPEGLRLERNVDRADSVVSQTGRKLDYAIITLLSLALIYFVWESRYAVPTTDDAAVAQNEAAGASNRRRSISIAVLPFINMSSDPEQEYFSDGITEELLYALAGIPELAVTSRTSAFSFKGKGMSTPKIAAELGVAHVLEGSVRKSGNQLRITAQLIEVERDQHLWSATYDRELTDIFAVQTEISENIAAALKVNLLGGTAPRSATGAVLPAAYDLYLHGLQQRALDTYASLAKATDYYAQALRLDPQFVSAYAGLGWAYVNQIGQGSVSTEDNLPKIRQVTRRGLELDPENAGLIGLASELAFRDGDLEQAVRLFRRALELQPPYYEVRGAYANALRQQGRMAEAARVGRDWLAADPLNPDANREAAYSHEITGQFDVALAAASRMQTIAPDNPYGLFVSGIIKINYLGELASGIIDIEGGIKISPNDHEGACILAISHFSIGAMALGDAWVEKGRQLAPDATFVQAAGAYGLVLRGELEQAQKISLQALASHRDFERWWGGFITLRLAVDALIDQGEPVRAVEMVLEAEPKWAAFMQQSPVDAPHLSANQGKYGTAHITDYFPDFARALRAAGDISGANNILAHAEAIQQWRREHGLVISDTRAAEIYALHGRGDEALDALERAEKNGSIFVYWQYRLIHNRIFDVLRGQLRFKALVQRVKAEMQRQRLEFNEQRSIRDKPGGT